MNRFFRISACFITVQCILLTPLISAITVQAATTTPSTTCNPQQLLAGAQADPITSADASITGDSNGNNDPGDGSDSSTSGSPVLSAVDVAIAKQNPFFDQSSFDQAMQNYAKYDNGYYDTASNTWYLCSTDNLELGLGSTSINYDTAQYLSSLTYPVNRITFDNPLDRYALTGEPCTLFKAGNVCNETTTSTPVLNPDGTPVLDTTGKPETTQTPKYYTDIWPNGQWDAPKADSRIMQTLVYLVTPKSLGGAGEESIEVGKILQTSKTDTDFPQSPTSVSSHYYDSSNPEDPGIIATGVDITGIDTLRITTKIVEKHRLGGDSVSYSYSSIPIKVSYQTDQGVQTATPAPNTDIYSASLGLFSSQLGSLLQSMGLNPDIDLSKANLNNFGSVASLIGQSLVSNLLNSPTGSLSGWNLGSVLNNMGRAYIAQQLGLPADSLAYGDTSNDIIRDVGQLTTEKALNLPTGSLSGDTSDAIWGNVGRRYLEDSIGVSPNTLATGATYSPADFLQRIGAGYIEQKLGLQPQSLQTTDWNTFLSSQKAKLLFSSVDASYVDAQLNMGTNLSTSGTDTYGFSTNDFTDPTGTVIGNHSQAGVARFLQVVGDRALQLSLGRFVTAVAGTSNVTSPVNTLFSLDPMQPIMDAFGITFDPTPYAGLTTLFKVNRNGFTPLYVDINSTGLSMESMNFITSDQMLQLAHLLADAKINNTFTSSGPSPSISLLTGLHNQLAAFNTIVQAVSAGVNSSLTELDASTLNNGGTASTTNLLPIQQGISAALGSIQKYNDALTTSISASGQSSASAALGLPGTLLNVDPTTGDYTTTAALTTDPVSAFLKGDVSSNLMQAVGRVVIGNRLASNATAQQSLAGMLQINTSTTYSTLSSVSSAAAALGQATNSGNGMLSLLDPTLWSKGGLQVADFERIFTKNLSSETFDRIGSQQLLSAAWNLYAVPALGNSTTNTVAQITQTLTQVSHDINFYLTRINDIKSIGQNLTSEIDSVSNIPQTLKDQLKHLNLTNIVQDTQNIQNFSAQYEATIGNLPLGQLSKTAQSQVTKAVQDMQEIAAGHSLSFNQAGISTSATSASTTPANSCLLPSAIQSFFKAGSSGFSTLATQVAACQIDNKLGLPVSSFYNWYLSKDYSVDSLESVVGKLYATQTNATLTDAGAKAKGMQILEASALNAVVGQVPGLSSITKNLGIGLNDVVALFTGNSSQTLQNLGGKMMDKYFNWSPGTAAAIVNPQCYDTVTKLTTTCDINMATQVRENALASAGLNELGISLNFPASFNIFNNLGSGDFVSDFGNSSISESLGLASNSFTGSFSNVRSANDPHTLLTALSWYDSTALSDISKLSADISTGINASIVGSVSNDLANAKNQMSNYLLDQISQASSPIWTVSAQTSTNPAVVNLAQTILSEQSSVLNQTLHTVLNDLVGDTSTPTMQDAAVFTNNLSTITSQNETKNLINQMLAFVNREQNLDAEYNDTPGKFKDFLTGQNGVSADDLAKNQGTVALGNVLNQKTLEPLLKNTPFASLINVFNSVTKVTGCGNGLNLGAFILGSSDATDSLSCLSTSMSGLSLQSILGIKSGNGSGGLTGITTNGVMTSLVNDTNICASGYSFDDSNNPKDQFLNTCVLGQAPASNKTVAQINADIQNKIASVRANLLNNFLDSSWGMNLEKNLDLEPGTLRALALKPQDAPEIAIDQGLRLIGTQLLGVKPSDLGQDDTIKGMYLTLSQSLLAGFCPVNPLTSSGSSVSNGDLQLIVSTQQSCSINFNTQRSLANLQSNLSNFIGTQYQNGTLPKEFGLADIGMVLAGGTQGVYLDALARIAAQTNSQLGSGPNAHEFYINFNDIRAATGFSQFGNLALDTAGTAQVAQWVRDNVATSDSNTCITGSLSFDPLNPDNTCPTNSTITPIYGMSDQQVVYWYTSSAADAYTQDDQAARSQNVVSQFNQGRNTIVTTFQHSAQQRLQYELSDAAAYEIDPHIPVGFTHAMFAGSTFQRAQMLGEYAINIIYSDTTFLKNLGLTQQQADDLYTFGSNCFSSAHNCNNIPTSSLSVVDNWIDKETGLNLPSGMSAGLIAWSTTGFNSAQFNATTIRVGNQSIPSAGILLEKWGMQKIFTWADKALGLQFGSVYQMYSAGAQVVQALKALEVANNIADVADQAANTLGGGNILANANASQADAAANKAQSNLTAAEAAGVALVVNTVFRGQISSAEKSLGLVPGTGAIAVSILTSLAFGAAAPWAEIALFVGLNLFGVYKVEIFQQATADGYYPFTGEYGDLQTTPQTEFPSSEPPIGEFDAKNQSSYRAGLEAAAQQKVYYILQDLLTMPQQWGAATGTDPKSLWIPQIYTARAEDVSNLAYLAQAPAPWQVADSYGYGQLVSQINSDGSTSFSYSSSGQLSGLFYDPTCAGSSATTNSTPSTATPSPTPSLTPSPSGSSLASATTAAATSCIFGNHIRLQW